MLIFLLQIILLVSFVGVLVIVFRKIPALSETSVDEEARFDLESWFSKCKLNLTSNLEKEKLDIVLINLLQKLLHRLRILAMKIENMSSRRIQDLEARSRNIKEREDDEAFWRKLRKPR